MDDQFVIVRSRDQGVVCGYLVALNPQPGGLAAAELREARQLHQWTQENKYYTLFEVANEGPDEARISAPIEGGNFTVFGVCGVYPCTERAIVRLTEARWNARASSSGGGRPAKTRRA